MEWRRFLPLILISLAGCSVIAPVLQDTATAVASPIPTETATPVPLAATVNDELIPLEEYNLEVARFERAQTALGIPLATLGDYPARVLQSMIEERVAAQAAKTAGLTVTPEQVDTAYQTVAQARGGPDALQAWFKDNLYTEASYRAVLQRQLLAQAMTSQIADQVPSHTEQVHARHILVGSQGTADYLLSLLSQGILFDALARKYSQDLSTRDNGGDLGWFAKGTLLAPEVETAAFSLEINQISNEAVKSALGFHIVQTLEKQPDRPLSTAAYTLLRKKAVKSWLTSQVAQAKIKILVATSS
jgi:parvulin-like peptidyl-prolyl isomerase